MGENSLIAWTHHTFNPWWGCTKVSPGCENCYAARVAVRGGVKWGPQEPRRFFNESHWHEPLKWNNRACRLKERQRVFCGSMCDVFDPVVSQGHRDRLWHLILDTPQLDWLILTKRPENLKAMLPIWWHVGLPHVRLMVTVEDQTAAEVRMPHLLEIPSQGGYGISVEPMLGFVDLSAWLIQHHPWVICGGESGPGFRQLDLAWVRFLRDQCLRYGSKFFYKQDSGTHPTKLPPLDGVVWDQVP